MKNKSIALVDAKKIIVPSYLATEACKRGGETINYHKSKVIAIPNDIENRGWLRRNGVILRSLVKPETASPFPVVFKHQIEMMKFYLSYRQCINGSEMGTAKTAPTIWSMMTKLKAGTIGKVLIVSPLTCVMGVWERSINQLYPMEEIGVLLGTTKQRLKALGEDNRIDLINYHGIKILFQDLIDKKYELVIIDEVSFYRNYHHASSSHYKTMLRFLRILKPQVWGITGEYLQRDPLNAWAIARIVYYDRNPFPKLSSFRRWTMDQVSEYIWKTKPGFEEHVVDIVSPTICFRKKECLDLPPVTVQYRKIDLKPKHNAAIRDMKREALLEFGNKGISITAANSGVLAFKLIQMSIGMVYDDNKDIVDFGIKDRIDEIIDLIRRNQNGKHIVFAPYIHMIDELYDQLTAAKIGRIVVVTGKTSNRNRKIYQTMFNDRQSDVTTWLAHPQTCSHGLDLTAGSLCIWAGPYYNNDVFKQANERYNRPGQTRGMSEYRLYSTYLEKRVYAALDGMGSMADAVKEWLTSKEL